MVKTKQDEGMLTNLLVVAVDDIWASKEVEYPV